MIICGTGHRPNKLGGYGEAAHEKLVRVALAYLGSHRPNVVISGMALGWDTALAEAAVQLKIPLRAYIPFVGQESKWPPISQQKYHIILMQAQEIIDVCEPGYAVWKMQKRNEAMVNDSQLVLALWDGSAGGTANCIAYAQRVDKPIHNLWGAYEKL